MMDINDTYYITSLDALQMLYGSPSDASIMKELSYVHPHYRAFIEAAPFVVLATAGPDGLDASPRGDSAGFVSIVDEKTLLIPDRRGNNRLDSLRNILADPRVALLFLVPGIGETLRINGHARISTDPDLLARFSENGKLPRSVIAIQVETVYFQCSRALLRSELWNPAKHLDKGDIPSPSQILSDISAGTFDGEAYDQALPERLRTTLY